MNGGFDMKLAADSIIKQCTQKLVATTTTTILLRIMLFISSFMSINSPKNRRPSTQTIRNNSRDQRTNKASNKNRSSVKSRRGGIELEIIRIAGQDVEAVEH